MTSPFEDAGKKFESAFPAAEARYIEIARSLGWTGRVETEEQMPKPAQEDDVDLDNLSDDEVNVPSHKTANASMGIRVSSLENPAEDENSEESLHGYAISGDADKLESLLIPGLDVDSRDQYVIQSAAGYLRVRYLNRFFRASPLYTWRPIEVI